MKQPPTCFPSTNLDFDEAPTSRASMLSFQCTNLVFRISYSKETNPSLLGLIENVNSVYLNVLDIFITVLFLSKILHWLHCPLVFIIVLFLPKNSSLTSLCTCLHHCSSLQIVHTSNIKYVITVSSPSRSYIWGTSPSNALSYCDCQGCHRYLQIIAKIICSPNCS